MTDITSGKNAQKSSKQSIDSAMLRHRELTSKLEALGPLQSREALLEERRRAQRAHGEALDRLELQQEKLPWRVPCGFASVQGYLGCVGR